MLAPSSLLILRISEVRDYQWYMRTALPALERARRERLIAEIEIPIMTFLFFFANILTHSQTSLLNINVRKVLAVGERRRAKSVPATREVESEF